MRRTVPALLAVLALAAPARAAAPQVTDPAGDANFTGTGVATAPASLDTLDIRLVRWWADTAAQHASLALAAPDPAAPARYVLRLATPACAVTLTWETAWDTAYLAGCGDARWYAPPSWSGGTLTFTLPRTALPSWLAAGTTVHGLGATAAPVAGYVVGELYPPADDAAGTAKYVVGS
ncbi:MAG TPA: hypothetical protein VFQ85_17920 [Mycobacteriales bacterium]|nr:hypothetical protein [Mycobacteriales bacterium]